MTTLQRRSPKLAESWAREDVRRAVDALEDRAQLKRKTPLQTDDGFDGEQCFDEDYRYLYVDGVGWTRIALIW